MDVPPPDEMLRRLRTLPAAGPLFARMPRDLNLYLVGGAVRDMLLGGAPKDLDLVVEGDPEAVATQLGSAVRAHDRFGTAAVRLDGYRYDIARARRERYAHPGALPDVEPASIDADLLRRDFTVNALAVAVGGESPGALKWAPKALEDLQAKRLRILHERSFLDDPTRLFRLVRYASRLRFGIDPHTRALADQAIASGALQTVSGPRIGAELRLLAREPDPINAMIALEPLRLDDAIYPGFWLKDEPLARRALRLLPADGRRDLLTLGLAARDVPASELRKLLDTLGFEARERATIVAVATRSEQLSRRLAEAQTPAQIAGAAMQSSLEPVALAGALGPEDAAGQWLERLRLVRLEIGGEDLIDAGVPQGPVIGRALRAALEAKLDGRAGTREEELAVALEAARSSL